MLRRSRGRVHGFAVDRFRILIVQLHARGSEQLWDLLSRDTQKASAQALS